MTLGQTSKALNFVVLLKCILVCYGRKNVLFLVADDMRPQLGAYYGEDFPAPVHPEMHTPNLDALASRSLLLKRAYVQQALCSPSRTSLLTGRRPDTTHVYDLYHYFRDVGGNFTTLPQYFKQNGYVTAGIGKIFHPGHASGGDDPISWTEPYFHGIANFESKQHSWEAIVDEKLIDNPLIDKQIADHAIKMLRTIRFSANLKKKNFFIAVGFRKPHLPFVFPRSMLKFYSNVKLPDNPYAPVHMPDIAWVSYAGLRSYADIKVLNRTGAINTTLPDDVVVALRRAYYSALTWSDMQLGRVVRELNALGLANSTIISFWGDHGFQLGEHGEWCKQTNFELATHAPMMLHIPGVTDAGISTRELTEFVDLFPTLSEAAGLGPIPKCPENSTFIDLCSEGTSFLPLIKNPKKSIKSAAFSQYPRNQAMGYTIRTNRYRYTEWPLFNHKHHIPDWNKLYGVELYDHEIDPDENMNRAGDRSYAETVRTLKSMLRKGWRKAIKE